MGQRVETPDLASLHPLYLYTPIDRRTLPHQPIFAIVLPIIVYILDGEFWWNLLS